MNAKPKVKTLCDKLCATIKDRQNAVLKHEGASEISEEVSETDQLLDVITLEKDEIDGKKAVEKEKLTALEKRLVDAAEQVRHAAANRKDGASENTTKKKTRKRVRYDEDNDEWPQLVKSEVKRKREAVLADQQLRTSEIILMRERFEGDKKDGMISREQSQKQ